MRGRRAGPTTAVFAACVKVLGAANGLVTCECGTTLACACGATRQDVERDGQCERNGECDAFGQPASDLIGRRDRVRARVQPG
jgi:hypothetical protein